MGNSHIADNVRVELARRSQTQGVLVSLLGLPTSSVSRRMRGETPFRDTELVLIADYLSIDIASLFRPRLTVVPAQDTG